MPVRRVFILDAHATQSRQRSWEPVTIAARSRQRQNGATAPVQGPCGDESAGRAATTADSCGGKTKESPSMRVRFVVGSERLDKRPGAHLGEAYQPLEVSMKGLNAVTMLLLI